MKILEVRNLKVFINNHLILNNINFEVAEGEIIGIIGPNGAGKTTLLKAILGLIEYEGEIKYKGKNINNFLNEISYIPQNFDFDRKIPLTVSEFFKITNKNFKSDSEIIKEIGLNKFLDKKLGELSGGQLQRVLIANSLFKKPKLILMDEPTSGIDIEGEKKFYEILVNLNEKYNITIIFVSHEIDIVYHFAKKIICLNKDLLCYGDVKKYLTKETLRALYGDEFAYQIHQHEN
ncbi:MAG: zinc ABC transporter ATP-binding protein [Candidatus Parcubacteria bacterium]|nr:MAG: zinc ABC transporter ATP-binding protein [Candidatus Parcubacteria bacterium]